MLKALLEARAAQLAALESLIKKAEDENRDFTAEESADYDKRMADLAALDARIKRAQDLQSRQSAAAQPATAANVQPISADPVREAARGGNGGRHAQQFESLAEFLACVARNPNDQRLANLYGERAAASDMRMDDGPRGGFMVPTQFRDELLQVEPGAALVRPRARVIPAGDPPDAAISFPTLDQSGAAPGNIFGGMQVQWIGEAVTKPRTDFKLANITLQPQEVAGTLRITDKLLRNWVASASMISQMFRQAIAQAEDFAFINGDGLAKPLGYMKSGAAMKIERQGAGAIVYEDVLNMAARILLRGGSPTWVASQSLMPSLFTIKDDEGHFIWVPNAQDGSPGRLLGYPLVWSEHVPTLGSEGDLSLATFPYYLIKDGSGPFVAASEHVYFEQNMTVFKAFWNVDGQPWMKAPITLENDYEVSPFVILDDAVA